MARLLEFAPSAAPLALIAFLMVTVIGIFAQLIIDNLGRAFATLFSVVKHQEGSGVRALSHVGQAILAIIGVGIICVWFVSQRAVQVQVSGGQLDLKLLHNIWLAALCVMLVIGIWSAWSHPFCKKSLADALK